MKKDFLELISWEYDNDSGVLLSVVEVRVGSVRMKVDGCSCFDMSLLEEDVRGMRVDGMSEEKMEKVLVEFLEASGWEKVIK